MSIVARRMPNADGQLLITFDEELCVEHRPNGHDEGMGVCLAPMFGIKRTELPHWDDSIYNFLGSDMDNNPLVY